VDNGKIIQSNPKKKPNMADYAQTYEDFSWEKAEAELVYNFDDGKSNIAYNCVDRHADGDKKDKTALIYDGADGTKEKYSFSDLKSLTNQFANVLVDNEVKKGDRVFIFLPPIPERYVAFLGILKMGGIAGTMFAAFQELALKDRLIDSEASVVITSPELYPRIENIRADLPNLKKVIIVERSQELPVGDHVISYDQSMQSANTDFDVLHMDKNDYSYMLYTSGTTGKPKGVVHSHGDILQAMTTTSYSLDVQDDDVYWCTADLGWVTGVVYGV